MNTTPKEINFHSNAPQKKWVKNKEFKHTVRLKHS